MKLLNYLRHPGVLSVMIILVTFMIVFGGEKTREASWKGKLLVGLTISGVLFAIWFISWILR